LRVPVLGRVPAGGPREAIEEVEGELLLDPDLVGDGEVFSLRVKGDSMTEAHICDGDYVLVRAQAHAEEGEIVVAVIDGEATVKRFRRRKGQVRFEAANPAYPPIVVPPGAPAFRIAGKVVGVYRKF
jgi:repressor LexA